MDSDQNLVAFSIIAEAGNAKSLAVQAIEEAMECRFPQAEETIQACEEALVAAHDIQTELLRQEMGGEGQPVHLLMVHAQDHLSSALLLKDLSKQFLQISRRLAALEGEQV